MMKIIKAILLITAVCALAFGDDADTVGVDVGAGISADAAADTVNAINDIKDIKDIKDDADMDLAELMAPDKATTAQPPPKMGMIRREYDYKAQTRLAIIMMAFIAVILTTSQSMNPR